MDPHRLTHTQMIARVVFAVKSEPEKQYDITWCPKHDAVNQQCCGGTKEVWGYYEDAINRKEESPNVQD